MAKGKGGKEQILECSSRTGPGSTSARRKQQTRPESTSHSQLPLRVPRLHPIHPPGWCRTGVSPPLVQSSISVNMTLGCICSLVRLSSPLSCGSLRVLCRWKAVIPRASDKGICSRRARSPFPRNCWSRHSKTCFWLLKWPYPLTGYLLEIHLSRLKNI